VALCEAVKSYQADAGIAFDSDSDADHVVMVDEMGDLVMGETFRDGVQSAYSAGVDWQTARDRWQLG
jgi:hypothetical protein